jgi:hypothetical protein
MGHPDMRKTSAFIIALAACGALAGPALADDNRCAFQPRERWMPIEQVNARAQAMGYTVREIESDDGCWEVKGVDRNGARIEIKLDPVSGEPVRR